MTDQNQEKPSHPLLQKFVDVSSKLPIPGMAKPFVEPILKFVNQFVLAHITLERRITALEQQKTAQ